MPLFNPLPLVRNPLFKTPGGFTVRRYTVTVDNDGVATRTHQDFDNVEGVIVPANAQGLVRDPNMERQTSSITIYTDFILTLGDASIGMIADDVIWHGQLFQVVDQDDWSDFGFNVVRAELQEPGGRLAA